MELYLIKSENCLIGVCEDVILAESTSSESCAINLTEHIALQII